MTQEAHPRDVLVRKLTAVSPSFPPALGLKFDEHQAKPCSHGGAYRPRHHLIAHAMNVNSLLESRSTSTNSGANAARSGSSVSSFAGTLSAASALAPPVGDLGGHEFVSGRLGIKLNDDGRVAQVNYYSEDGVRVQQTGFYPDQILRHTEALGIDMGALRDLGAQLDAAGVGYRPGEQWPGTGSNHGIDFEDLLSGGLGTTYDWRVDPLASMKGPSAVAMLQENRRLADRLGLQFNLDPTRNQPNALTTAVASSVLNAPSTLALAQQFSVAASVAPAAPPPPTGPGADLSISVVATETTSEATLASPAALKSMAIAPVAAEAVNGTRTAIAVGETDLSHGQTNSAAAARASDPLPSTASMVHGGSRDITAREDRSVERSGLIGQAAQMSIASALTQATGASTDTSPTSTVDYVPTLRLPALRTFLEKPEQDR